MQAGNSVTRETESIRKKRVADAIKALEAKKMKLNDTTAVESRKLEMEIAELKKMTKLLLVDI